MSVELLLLLLVVAIILFILPIINQHSHLSSEPKTNSDNSSSSNSILLFWFFYTTSYWYGIFHILVALNMSNHVHSTSYKYLSKLLLLPLILTIVQDLNAFLIFPSFKLSLTHSVALYLIFLIVPLLTTSLRGKAPSHHNAEHFYFTHTLNILHYIMFPLHLLRTILPF
jgi:hypothetical protein